MPHERTGNPTIWRGPELFERADALVQLDPSEQAALAGAASDAIPAARIEELRNTLEDGPGVVVLRGFPLDGVDGSELEQRFRTFVEQLGTPVPQTPDGARLLRVEDRGYPEGDPRLRGPHTPRRLSFHTDRCDVIAFLCVRPARVGGENHVISSKVLYDELARRDPAALALLGEPYPWLRHTFDTANERPFVEQPIFAPFQGHFAATFLRVLIERADAHADAPSLTTEQRRALDVLEELAEDPTLYARRLLAAGDVLLLNNWTTFHRRTAFEDGDPPRLYLRAWLAMPNSRPLDPRYAAHFGDTAAGAVRGGVPQR